MFHVQLWLNKSATEFLLNMYVNKPFYMKKLAVETNIFEKRNILRSNQIIFTLIVATENLFFIFV